MPSAQSTRLQPLLHLLLLLLLPLLHLLPLPMLLLLQEALRSPLRSFCCWLVSVSAGRLHLQVLLISPDPALGARSTTAVAGVWPGPAAHGSRSGPGQPERQRRLCTERPACRCMLQHKVHTMVGTGASAQHTRGYYCQSAAPLTLLRRLQLANGRRASGADDRLQERSREEQRMDH